MRVRVRVKYNNIIMAYDKNYRFDVLNTEPLELSGDADKLTYRKQLIYTGSFIKKTDKSATPFNIKLTDLHHWNNTFAAMSQEGIEVPLPVEHTTDPEKKRGSIIGLEVAKDKKGRDSLFGYVRFNTAEGAKHFSNSNVSIFVPKSRTSGKGTEYLSPIEHVALTDYPVIPDLEKFETLALSEVPIMNVRDLATKLGVASDVADADLEAAINTAIDGLLKEVKKPAPTVPAADTKTPTVAASLVGMVKRSRTSEINALVSSNALNRNAANKLIKTYCDDSALSLSLSSESGDNYDSIIDAIRDNERVPLKEKSGPQVLELSFADINDPKKNPLLADAERRAAEAKR